MPDAACWRAPRRKVACFDVEAAVVECRSKRSSHWHFEGFRIELEMRFECYMLQGVSKRGCFNITRAISSSQHSLRAKNGTAVQ